MVFSFVSLGLLAGCTHLGPRTIPSDRYDYSSAIADSWKEQILLNIVKTRYVDLPVFIDVSSIVSGYSLQASISMNGTLAARPAPNSMFFGGEGIYTDRPTITYTPLTGEKFLRGLVAPIDPKNIFFLLQSGYAADFILSLTVESLNGVRNRSTTAGFSREADPEFIRALQLIREVQAAGGLGMRLEEDKLGGTNAVAFFRTENMPAAVTEKVGELHRLLKLAPDIEKFTLIYSPAREEDDELAVGSRSMLQIMLALAYCTDVPEAHLREGRVAPLVGVNTTALVGQQEQLMHIHSSKEKPANAFASVRYRDYWFWVDDTDWHTKRAFTAIVFFFTLAESSGREQLLPIITIPAQ